MIEVSAYEAKTHLAELLRKVQGGERVLITKHHIAVAVMTPAARARKRPLTETVDALKVFRKRNTLQGFSVKEMIEEGRR